jgi:hypothetical protein
VSAESDKIDTIMEEAQVTAFEKIEKYRRSEGLAPSKVMNILESHWGMGDIWADWWSDGVMPGDNEEWS